MKVNNYKKFVERVDDDAWEGATDNDWNEDWNGILNKKDDEKDFYDDDYYGRHDYSKYDNKDEFDDIEDEDMGQLKSLLLTMFKNKGIENVSITNADLDLSIRCSMQKKEKLSDIVSLFDLLNKLKTDILPQYDSEFDMWQNYSGQTFEFGFYYNEGDNDDYDNDFEEDDLNSY